MAALKVNNIAAKDVTLVSLTPADMVAAWKRGDIDAGYVWGPFSHTMEGDGGKEILATQALQKNGYYVWNDYVVRKEFAEKYPDIVVKFLQTYQQSRGDVQQGQGGDGQAGRAALESERSGGARHDGGLVLSIDQGDGFRLAAGRRRPDRNLRCSIPRASWSSWVI